MKLSKLIPLLQKQLDQKDCEVLLKDIDDGFKPLAQCITTDVEKKECILLLGKK